MASTMAPRIVRSDEEFQKLVALIQDVDSVELKVTVPEHAQLSTVRALGLDALQAHQALVIRRFKMHDERLRLRLEHADAIG